MVLSKSLRGPEQPEQHKVTQHRANCGDGPSHPEILRLADDDEQRRRWERREAVDVEKSKNKRADVARRPQDLLQGRECSADVEQQHGKGDARHDGVEIEVFACEHRAMVPTMCCQSNSLAVLPHSRFGSLASGCSTNSMATRPIPVGRSARFVPTEYSSRVGDDATGLSSGRRSWKIVSTRSRLAGPTCLPTSAT